MPEGLLNIYKLPIFSLKTTVHLQIPITKKQFLVFGGIFQRVSHKYPTKSSEIKSFLKNLTKVNLNKAHNLV